MILSVVIVKIFVRICALFSHCAMVVRHLWKLVCWWIACCSNKGSSVTVLMFSVLCTCADFTKMSCYRVSRSIICIARDGRQHRLVLCSIRFEDADFDLIILDRQSTCEKVTCQLISTFRCIFYQRQQNHIPLVLHVQHVINWLVACFLSFSLFTVFVMQWIICLHFLM